MRRAETMIEVKIHLHCFSVSPACLCLGCMNMGCVSVCVREREKKSRLVSQILEYCILLPPFPPMFL